jgi:uncharacterized protein involved in cysteine biosynthesis
MTSRFEQDKFDEVLGQALKSHSESIPADFTQRMLSQIEQTDHKTILARVVLQERIALAACIAVAFLVVLVAAIFSGAVSEVLEGLTAGLVGRSVAFVEESLQTIQALGVQWRFILVVAAAISFCIYGLVDMFFGDRLRML